MSDPEPTADGKNPGDFSLRPNDLFANTGPNHSERELIESYNRRTDVARQAVLATAEADRLQYEFEMARLAANERDAKRRDALARLLIWLAGLAGAIVGGLIICMAFFGNPRQSDIAAGILKTLAIGGGGYGLISAFLGLIRRLMRDTVAPHGAPQDSTPP